jgi:hypothetical protein
MTVHKHALNYAQFLISAGGRRFVLVVFFGLMYSALLVSSHLDGAQYVTLQTLTVAAYLAANTIQKIKGDTA